MDKFFKLKENGTNVRTEVIAGITTFFTMAYVIFVNPNILSQTGMPWDGVFVATIIAAVIGTMVMALVANVPYAQAPGMGLNAFFTYTVCFALGFSWQQALAIVFICGIINIIITVTQIRKSIIKAIPVSLQYAIGGGIGLFIAYIGIKNAQFIKFTADAPNFLSTIPDDSGNLATVVVNGGIVPAIVNFTDKNAQLALIGLAIMIVLMLLKVKGSIFIGVIATTLIGIPMGITSFGGDSHSVSAISETFLKLDFAGLFRDSSRIFIVLSTILAFSMSDTFDTIGTFIGTGRKSGIFDDKDEAALFSGKGFKSKLDKALFADATATSVGALLGTSNTTTYVESAAGIAAGGKTGLTSVVTAVLFLACLFLTPIAGAVPSAATAPALIIVGILMTGSFGKINWEVFEEALPAFLTVAFMAFSYSISNGIAAGFIVYVITKLATCKAREVHPIMYIVSALFLLNFVISGVLKL